jgi:hypothetical protein
MFIGYAKEHSGDCYEMWSPVTRRKHVTRDVIWLRRMFYSPAPTTFPHAGNDHVAVAIPITVPARGQITNDDDSDGHTTDSEEDYKTKGAPSTDNDTDDEDDVKDNESGSEDEDEEFLEHSKETQNRTTASGRAVRQPVRFQDGLDSANAAINI